MNFRDAYEFDPTSYGGSGGLLGRLLQLQAEQSRYQPSAGDRAQAPSTPRGADTGPSSRAPNGYPPYDSNSYSGQGGLLGRLLALQGEQSRYQSNGDAGVASPPASPAGEDTARLAQGMRNLTGNDTAAPSTINFIDGLARAYANGVPVIGALNNTAEAALGASLAPVLNPVVDTKNQLNEPTWQGRYGDALRTQNDIDARFAGEHPVAATLAGVAGNLSTFGALGQTELGKAMLGLAEGPLSEMMLRGATTRAAISGVDAAIRGLPAGVGFWVSSLLGAGTPAAFRAAQTILRRFR